MRVRPGTGRSGLEAVERVEPYVVGVEPGQTAGTLWPCRPPSVDRSVCGRPSPGPSCRCSPGWRVLVAIALFTWGIAAYISGAAQRSASAWRRRGFRWRAPRRRRGIVSDDGPIMLPGLNTTTGERTFVLDHEGDDPASGWVVYAAYPADGDPACTVEQVVGTDEFIDCDGNHHPRDRSRAATRRRESRGRERPHPRPRPERRHRTDLIEPTRSTDRSNHRLRQDFRGPVPRKSRRKRWCGGGGGVGPTRQTVVAGWVAMAATRRSAKTSVC